MSNVLDAIPPIHRDIIVEELTRRNPELLAELRESQKPTNEQTSALVTTLSRAFIKSLGPDYAPNERGKAIDNAIGQYLLAWPKHR